MSINHINSERKASEWGSPAPSWLFTVNGREYGDVAGALQGWLKNSDGATRSDARPGICTRKHPSHKPIQEHAIEPYGVFFLVASIHSDCPPFQPVRLR